MTWHLSILSMSVLAVRLGEAFTYRASCWGRRVAVGSSETLLSERSATRSVTVESKYASRLMTKNVPECHCLESNTAEKTPAKTRNG